MEIDPVTVELTCLFCDAVLENPSGAQPKSGELLTCQACGQGNDYDSCVEVAKEKGAEILADKIRNGLANEIKKIFR